MEAVAVGDGKIAARPTLIRSISSLLTIASGGSIGREGPMVQLAALIGSKVGQLRKAPTPRRRLLVACGAAAGIASAYNAPIAGALFVAEIVMGSFAMESFGPLLVASVSADATIHRVLGYGPVFTCPRFISARTGNSSCMRYSVCLLGHLAPPFLALLDWSKARFRSLPGPLYAKFALGGLIVGLISIAFPQVWGNGYSVVDAILHDRLDGLAFARGAAREGGQYRLDRRVGRRGRRVHADPVHRCSHRCLDRRDCCAWRCRTCSRARGPSPRSEWAAFLQPPLTLRSPRC